MTFLTKIEFVYTFIETIIKLASPLTMASQGSVSTITVIPPYQLFVDRCVPKHLIKAYIHSNCAEQNLLACSCGCQDGDGPTPAELIALNDYLWRSADWGDSMPEVSSSEDEEADADDDDDDDDDDADADDDN